MCHSSECVTFWLAKSQNAISGFFWLHHCLAKHCWALLSMEITSDIINAFHIYPQLPSMPPNIRVRNERKWNSVISVRFHVMLTMPATFPLVSSCSGTATPSSGYWLPRNSVFPFSRTKAAGSHEREPARGSEPRTLRTAGAAPGTALPGSAGSAAPLLLAGMGVDVRRHRQNSAFTLTFAVSSDFLCWRFLYFFFFSNNKKCFAL